MLFVSFIFSLVLSLHLGVFFDFSRTVVFVSYLGSIWAICFLCCGPRLPKPICFSTDFIRSFSIPGNRFLGLQVEHAGRSPGCAPSPGKACPLQRIHFFGSCIELFHARIRSQVLEPAPWSRVPGPFWPSAFPSLPWFRGCPPRIPVIASNFFLSARARRPALSPARESTA
jgi:hypothetical protein